MKKINVRPDGKKVRLPPSMGGGLMDEKGMSVPRDAYWLRRLRGGDVVLVQDSKPKSRVVKDKE